MRFRALAGRVVGPGRGDWNWRLETRGTSRSDEVDEVSRRTNERTKRRVVFLITRARASPTPETRGGVRTRKTEGRRARLRRSARNSFSSSACGTKKRLCWLLASTIFRLRAFADGKFRAGPSPIIRHAVVVVLARSRGHYTGHTARPRPRGAGPGFF